jgi:hypothetical protein
LAIPNDGSVQWRIEVGEAGLRVIIEGAVVVSRSSGYTLTLITCSSTQLDRERLEERRKEKRGRRMRRPVGFW